MQNFDFVLAPGKTRIINAHATFIRYMKADAGTGDTEIEFKAMGGSDTVLMRPGQSYRLPIAEQNWLIRNRGAETISGVVLLGSGDFVDNRISGDVQVVGTVRTQETGMQYGASWSSVGPYMTVQNQAYNIVPPSANVNGMIIHQSIFQHKDGTTSAACMIAKSTAPTSIVDGDVLNYGSFAGEVSKIETPVLIAPGKGIYFISQAVETGGFRSFLYTML